MLFADIWGEPKQKQVDAATAFVRAAGAGLVVCLGGGSAMDVGKIAATVAAPTGRPPTSRWRADPCQVGRPQNLYSHDRRHRLGVLLDQHLHQ